MSNLFIIKNLYRFKVLQTSIDEVAVVAVLVWGVELPLMQDGDTLIGYDGSALLQVGGLCALGQANCYMAGTVFDNNAKYRLAQYMNIVGNNPYQKFIGYSVKRNTVVSGNGTFVYFSYHLNIFYAPNGVPTGSFSRFGSVEQFKNSVIVNELEKTFKPLFEDHLKSLYGR